MGRVNVLPDALANQIAAGEVVERPASVVRELIENALDADASRIVIEIKGGGTELVRIVDDGFGMSEADARAALLRHATSKIGSADDLLAIHTLGFRGEALPSIASVSRFRLTTRERDQDAGVELTVDGGGELLVKAAGCPTGTVIEVADLFHNVPARRKFLKQQATEVGHITTLVTAYALGHPHVHFRLLRDGRVAADYPAARRLDQRIFQVLGKEVARRLHEVRLDGPVRVLGYISDGTFVKANSSAVHAFVNGRHVRDRTVTHGLLSAYAGRLERGYYPHAVLYVHVPYGEVDVNVHPAKAEIRFVDGGSVHEAIARACRITLSGLGGLGEPARGYESARGGAQLGPVPPRQQAFAWHAGGPRPIGPVREADGGYGRGGAFYEHERRPLPPVPARPWTPAAPAPASAPAAGARVEARPAPAAPRALLGGVRPLGELGRGLLAVAEDDALAVVDLASAWTFVFACALGEPAAPEPLIFPTQRELDATEAARLDGLRAALRERGVEVDPFGGPTWQLVGVPASLAGTAPDALFDALLGSLRGGAGTLADALGGLARAAALAAPTGEDAVHQLLAQVLARGGLEALCAATPRGAWRVTLAAIARELGR